MKILPNYNWNKFLILMNVGIKFSVNQKQHINGYNVEWNCMAYVEIFEMYTAVLFINNIFNIAQSEQHSIVLSTNTITTIKWQNNNNKNKNINKRKI